MKFLEKIKTDLKNRELKKKENELLTYENGKVKPIPKPINEEDTLPLTQKASESGIGAMPPPKEKEKTGLSKSALIILTALMLVLAIWIGIEIKNVLNSNPVEDISQNQAKSNVLASNNNVVTNKNLGEKVDDVNTVFTPTKEKILTGIDIINETNIQLLSLVKSNEQYISEYENQNLNRLTLQANLADNQVAIDGVIQAFKEYEKAMNELGLSQFYTASISRYNNLDSYSKQQLYIAKEYGSSFIDTKNKYLTLDEEAALQQQNALISILNKAEIKFKMNNESNQIEILE